MYSLLGEGHPFCMVLDSESVGCACEQPSTRLPLDRHVITCVIVILMCYSWSWLRISDSVNPIRVVVNMAW